MQNDHTEANLDSIVGFGKFMGNLSKIELQNFQSGVNLDSIASFEIYMKCVKNW